jgi:hypothetical protein
LSVIGILLQLAYRLHRHFIAAWSLARWLGTVLVVAGLVVLIAHRSVTWGVILIAVLFFLYAVAIFWASRKHYLQFVASPSARALLRRQTGASTLEPGELVPVRAAGWFTVHGQEQYYVNLDAEYESVHSREHIVLAQVPFSRFLWLGKWPGHETGHWYMFIEPTMLRQVRAGYLHFGSQPQLAIEIVYSSGEEIRHSAYLASEAAVLRRIWEDLMRDAPPQANNRLGGDGG